MSEIQNNLEKDSWDKLEIFAKFIGATLIPIAIALFGHFYSSATKDKEFQQKQGELELKYIELAVGLLKTEPEEETKNLRNWAIDVVNEYSKVSLDQNVKDELKSNSLPSMRSNCQTKACEVVIEFLSEMINGADESRIEAKLFDRIRIYVNQNQKKVSKSQISRFIKISAFKGLQFDSITPSSSLAHLEIKASINNSEYYWHRASFEILRIDGEQLISAIYIEANKSMQPTAEAATD